MHATHMQKYFEDQTRRVQAILEQRLPPADTPPQPLHAAMRYSVFAGGKRLRPLLCLAAAAAAGGSDTAALLPAAALEVLHTYTLIHDDLPAMDNDQLRRGKPTLHVVYGEAHAILAGDALLTLAFEWLAETAAPAPYPPNQLSMELAQAAGSRGVIAGQAADIAAERLPPDAALLDFIHQHKTGDLIRAAARMGAIAAGADAAALAAVTAYGNQIGLAFQIVDDILNATADAVQLGKAGGSDAQRGKMTWVSVHGLDAARQTAMQLADAARQSLDKLPGDTAPLRELARMMIERKK